MCYVAAAGAAGGAAVADGPLPIGDAIGVGILAGSCVYRAYRGVRAWQAARTLAEAVNNPVLTEDHSEGDESSEEAEGESRPRETARQRRERQRREQQEARNRQMGGEPEDGDGTPRGNRRQNREFRDVVNEFELDDDQARSLHEEITGEDLDYQQIRERAQDMFGPN